MLTASDSENDLPIFPLLGPASRHDSLGFFYNYFSMLQFLPEAHVTKLLLDSAHDSMAYYEYCRGHGIQPFIDLNGKGGRSPVYKDDFTLERMASPSAKKVSACAATERKLRKDGRNSNAPWSALPAAHQSVSVSAPVLTLSMAEPSILS